MEEIIKYYVNLLIIQYRGKYKAENTIRTLLTNLQSNNIFLTIRNAFTIEKAVGKQLDILGKWIGQVRTFNVILDKSYFGFREINKVSNNLLGTYKLINQITKPASILTWNKRQASQYSLPDEDYRIILKLKIANNTTNSSYWATAETLFNLFGLTIVPRDNQNTTISYILFSQSINVLALIKNQTSLLPKPMGVKMDFIIKTNAKYIFGYKLITKSINQFLGTYKLINKTTLKGSVLTHNNIL